MDPFVAVAVSMLPASRSRVASTFKELRLQSDPGSDVGAATVLEAVLEACEVPEDERRDAGAAGTVARRRGARRRARRRHRAAALERPALSGAPQLHPRPAAGSLGAG